MANTYHAYLSQFSYIEAVKSLSLLVTLKDLKRIQKYVLLSKIIAVGHLPIFLKKVFASVVNFSPGMCFEIWFL